ncbi:RNA polymerase sigma-70 factor, sigma-E family [Micromonospora viridifaciens]|uniref:RNA polymerase sigma-70 factor, sigma-E family n=1 Tax=Micromonospora viridifaciens TaxID=1881 RepID=A0A1C4U855_MICVI|nr:SigE family RNA polymerase sigma factor [Micromonospora viridifaciens]SCE67880.1 RNA polymerase sigma-70 factor, sigma-E family [Micromonospora viridifaciens]
MPVDVEGYREFVAARLEPLRRTAYLLCGDWHTADDLVSSALIRLLRHWRRVSAMESPDAYARRTLLRVWLDERRRPWRRESAWAELPDRAVHATVDDSAVRITILGLLAELPPRRRAVLVLRYFCDLSVEETARELGCTPGTVKSQAARAIETLRGRMAVEEVRTDG